MKVLLGFILTFISSFAMAEHIQCRGLDGHKEQIAIQVNDIKKSEDGGKATLRVVSLKLFGRQDICKSASLFGFPEKNFLGGDLVVECNSQNSLHQATEEGVYSLQLSKTGLQKYQGTFCQGQGAGHEVSGVSFAQEACLKLQCLASKR